MVMKYFRHTLKGFVGKVDRAFAGVTKRFRHMLEGFTGIKKYFRHISEDFCNSRPRK